MPTREEINQRRQQLEGEIEERVAEAKKHARKAAKQVTKQAGQAKSSLIKQIEEHPLLFAGVALGAGFVAGGGLKATVSGPLMRVGGGLAWKFLVLPTLAATLTRALGGAPPDDETTTSET